MPVLIVVSAVGINCFRPVINYPRVVGAGGWPVVRIIPTVMFAPVGANIRVGGVKRGHIKGADCRN